MRYLCDSYTDIGGRENNEDSLLVFGSPNGVLLAVADGLGGHDCGEMASSVAVETLREEFCKDAFDPVAAIRTANARILQKQAEIGLAMKTTICLAWIKEDGGAVFAHVGDSRIYAFRYGEITCHSTDHSASQMAVTVGEITPDEIRTHPDRNVLLRALGVTQEVKVDTAVLAEDDFDSLLLCTDGFWEYIYEDEMIAQRGRSGEPTEWLLGMRELLSARVPAGNDNNTAVVMIKK